MWVVTKHLNQMEGMQARQNTIKSNNLANEQELQSYFIKNGKLSELENRQLIGWDEILEGGLSPIQW